ncbi:hypothetical protein JL100_017725 [Skermanella mucosa]|uniref:hypothetical protein n=1 Tax=Skermanella mucosa TaxID=1789672 RepID=UPI00192BB7A9|nr:hypothetical protein [Skermanella mucosa]UEM18929.1 hypothetical protein JL100_017725 [Skermanella mucosa]
MRGLGMLLTASVILTGATSATYAQQGQAQDCLAEVDQLAGSLGLNGSAPQAGSGGSAGSESLAQSGGVIQPPDIGAGRVVEPPNPSADGMDTAPAIPRQDGAPQGAVPGGQPEMGAAERAQVETLLLGARNAGRQGDTAQCMERLEEARELAGESGAGSPM